MNQLLNVVWSGIWLGSVYGAIAIALVISYRAARVVNMSVGAIFVFAALTTQWFQSQSGTVWVAAGNRQEIRTQQFNFRFDRGRNIEMTATNALNFVRKFIADHTGANDC